MQHVLYWKCHIITHAMSFSKYLITEIYKTSKIYVNCHSVHITWENTHYLMWVFDIELKSLRSLKALESQIISLWV